jgi:phenylacetate-CoA ligase
MNPLLSLYERMPHRLQSIAVSYQGWRVARSRYARAYREVLPVLLNQQWATSDHWERIQFLRLKNIVSEARNRVPYYENRLPDPNGVRTLDELLRAIPLLSKAEVRNDPQQFHNHAMRTMRTVAFRTSGTTGAPLEILQSVDAHSIAWAAMDRFWRWAGVRHGDRRLSFTGNRIITRENSTGPFGQYDWANNRMLMSVYHLGTATVDTYLDEIARFKPAFIDGYPSAISFCAKRAIETDRVIPVQACFPTAETLFPEQRAFIERGFQTRVFNQYGSAEGLAVVVECPAGALHVSPEVGIVEILDADGEPALPGEVGELVLTTLNNAAMPLLRYRIGDRARAVGPKTNCMCGRSMPVVGEIIGRQDDVVVTPDGRRIGMLSFNVFKWTTGIQESQIIQESLNRFSIKIVPGPLFTMDQADKAVRALKERVGEDVQVEVEIVDSLPRSVNGKLRAVISEVTA